MTLWRGTVPSESKTTALLGNIISAILVKANETLCMLTDIKACVVILAESRH